MEILCGLVVFSTSGLALYATKPVSNVGAEKVACILLAVVFWGTLLLPHSTEWRRRLNTYGIYSGCAVLGFCMALGLLSNSGFGLFLVMLSYFHLSEFVLITASHKIPEFESLLLNHGVQYSLALSLCFIERVSSPFRIPENWWIWGFIVASFGLIVRASALITAGKSFTHLIASRRNESHVLVTSGPYRYMRHPAYCGWFIWVVAAQVVAGNPLCAISFGVITWIFFRDRIQYEETLLLKIFGDDYARYRSATPASGLPFI